MVELYLFLAVGLTGVSDLFYYLMTISRYSSVSLMEGLLFIYSFIILAKADPEASSLGEPISYFGYPFSMGLFCNAYFFSSTRIDLISRYLRGLSK